jgi:hypothetical protein
MKLAPTSSVLSAFILAVGLTGCGEVDDSAHSGENDGRVHVETRTAQQELRPTNSSDPFGYEGAEAQSIVSPGGDYRVWWTDEGEHAVPSADADGSGVPDYVEMVAEVADEVAQKLADNGWKIAMNDDPGGSGGPPGGDGLFDIYLVDFSAGDGHYSRDWCTTNEHGVQQCAGHFRLENDFAGLNYPSPEYAARLVLSHEYFHAVQNAYTSDLPQWFSEGSATWFEEYFDPSQDDFERLTSLYFDEHDRTLNDRGRGPSDGFAYGASIFVYFLELHIGADGVRAIFERLATGEELLAAIEAEVADTLGSLQETFDLFATYNLFTGTYWVSDNGYPDAERFMGVEAESQVVDGAFNWNLDADPWAARYIKLTFDEAITLQKAPLDDFVGMPEFIAVRHAEYTADGTMHVVGSNEATRFGPEMSPLFVVISNGHTDDVRAAALQVRLAGPDDSGQGDEIIVERNDDNAEEGGCSTTPGGVPAAGLVWFLFVAVAFRRRGAGY